MIKDIITPKEYKALSQEDQPKRRRQIEKKLQMDFGKMLFQCEVYNKLNPNLIKWSYIANGEKRPGEVKEIMGKRGKLVKTHISRVGADLKIKGVRKGIFDYYFCIKKQVILDKVSFDIVYEIWLEAKAPDGKMTKDQLEFKKKAEGIFNIKIYEFRSVNEGIRILEQEGILIS